MRATTRTVVATATLGLAVTALVSAAVPAPTTAFNFLGGNLGLAQRDFRVFNNFLDGSANNNNTPHPNFPGALGAVMAIWKAHVEWGSVPYAGNGLGDGVSSNPVLGSGGANFDNSFQGEASSVGLPSDNVHSSIDTNGGSTLAFTVPPISSGWQIRYHENWTWQDGPGSNGSVDLQGVAVHEIGHSLGLDHSGTFGATMWPSISGSGVSARSIHPDDIAGVQAIYGFTTPLKCEITGLGGSTDIGQVLTISGVNFTATDNEVWFTRNNSNGIPSKVTGVPSTNGGTEINVTIPSDARTGEVLVKTSGNMFRDLSNPWPIAVTTNPGPPPLVQGVTPGSGAVGGFQEVVVTGQDFGGASSVQFGGQEAVTFTLDADDQITAITPPGSLGFVDVTVVDGAGSSTLPGSYEYVPNPPPAFDTVDPAVGEEPGGEVVMISGDSVLGVTSVEFGGAPGTDLTLLGGNELTVVTPPGFGTVDVTLIGNGSATLSRAYTYIPPAAGTFQTLGIGIETAFGTPTLTGFGDLTPGGQGFTLKIKDTIPLGQTTMFIGVSPAALPFKGGTLTVFPILISIPLVTDLAGNLTLPATIPPTTPGGAFVYLQAWTQDVSGPKGLSSTNGLELGIP